MKPKLAAPLGDTRPGVSAPPPPPQMPRAQPLLSSPEPLFSRVEARRSLSSSSQLPPSLRSLTFAK